MSELLTNARRMKKRKRFSMTNADSKDDSSSSSTSSSSSSSSAGCGSYTCNYCGRVVPNIRIKCAVCVDFDLCIECFSVGVELGEHQSFHAYSLLGVCALAYVCEWMCVYVYVCVCVCVYVCVYVCVSVHVCVLHLIRTDVFYRQYGFPSLHHLVDSC